MTRELLPLSADQVRRRMDPDALGFESTHELVPLSGMLGQERAEEALDFGVGIRRRGFNLYVLGPSGMGKHRMVRRVLEARAKDEAIPDDWVYVNRFEDLDRPRAIRLPPGRGCKLEKDMRRLTEELTEVLREAFETDEHREGRRAIEQTIEGRQEVALTQLGELAEQHGLKLMRSQGGLSFRPYRDGEVLKAEQFAALPESEQKKVREQMSGLEDALADMMREAPRWQREAHAALRDLERQIARRAAKLLMTEIREEHADLDEVSEWLSTVEDDIVENASGFIDEEEEGEPAPPTRVQFMDPKARYLVNLFIDRRGERGAPLVREDHPRLHRLAGRVEHRSHMGALISDFTMIKPGALHRANGGYLMVDAQRLLSSPRAWETLKRALRRGELEIDALSRELSPIQTLHPDPIPLDLKVVLIGPRGLYYRLSALDPDFEQLFKVAADFEDTVPWDQEHARDLARLMSGIAESEDILPLHKRAVAAVIEHTARLADDQQKLATNLTRICDVMRESDWIARRRGAKRIEGKDVAAAIDAADRRQGRLRQRVLDGFQDGTILVATSGEVVGQINGLSVMTIGQARIGQPNRITSRVQLGKGELVDIEREVLLGGPIHSKGVLILASYLGAKYGLERPLSLRASLVFEQSYGGVDGDSASCAELCALLSALADVPLKQSFAITGAVSQHGEVQAIGGVNEKIEGFFDVCQAGPPVPEGHGVLVPASNAQHLMLRQDVVEAVREKKFHVYAVGHVDEALDLLTQGGAAALHRAAEERLSAFAAAAATHARAILTQ